MTSADARLRAAVRAALDAGKSQVEFAREAETSRPHLNRWLQGKKQITLPTAEKLAAAAGVRLELQPK